MSYYVTLTDEQIIEFSDALDNFLEVTKRVFDDQRTMFNFGEVIEAALAYWQPTACEQLREYVKKQLDTKPDQEPDVQANRKPTEEELDQSHEDMEQEYLRETENTCGVCIWWHPEYIGSGGCTDGCSHPNRTGDAHTSHSNCDCDGWERSII